MRRLEIVGVETFPNVFISIPSIYANHPPDGPNNSPPDSRADSPQTAPRQPALAPFTKTL